MKVEQLQEGIKFGSKEFRTVEKFSRDILIGIEYEFHVGEIDYDAVLQSDDYEEAMDRIVDRELEEKKDEFVDGYVDDLISEYEKKTELYDNFYKDYREVRDLTVWESRLELEPIIERINGLVAGENNLSDILTSKQIAEFIQYMKQMGEIKDTLQTSIDHLVGEIDQDEAKEFNSLLGGIGNTILEDWDTFDESIGVITDFLDEFPDRLPVYGEKEQLPILFPEIEETLIDFIQQDDWDNMFDALEHLSGIPFSEYEELYQADFEDGLRDRAEDLWEVEFKEDAEDDARGYAHDQIDLAEIAYDIGAVGTGGDFEERADNIQDKLEEYGLGNIVRDIGDEEGIFGGVEVITEKLPLLEAMEVMKSMFNLIQEVGSTSNKTGMHTNMSFRGISFRDFDPVKLVMLLDDEYLRSDVKFPIRDYVNKILWSNKFAPSHDLSRTILHITGHNIDYALKSFAHLVPTQVKYQSINFSHTGHIDPDQRRIEFRYFGDKDYEHNYTQMRKDIYHAAYAMMAAFSPNFAKEEYYKSVLKFLDRYCKSVYNMSLMDVLNKLRRLPGNIDPLDILNMNDTEAYRRYFDTESKTKDSRLALMR